MDLKKQFLTICLENYQAPRPHKAGESYYNKRATLLKRYLDGDTKILTRISEVAEAYAEQQGIDISDGSTHLDLVRQIFDMVAGLSKSDEPDYFKPFADNNLTFNLPAQDGLQRRIHYVGLTDHPGDSVMQIIFRLEVLDGGELQENETRKVRVQIDNKTRINLQNVGGPNQQGGLYEALALVYENGGVTMNQVIQFMATQGDAAGSFDISTAENSGS